MNEELLENIISQLSWIRYGLIWHTFMLLAAFSVIIKELHKDNN